MLRPGLVRMRGLCPDDYGMHDHEYTLPPVTIGNPNGEASFLLKWLRLAVALEVPTSYIDT